VALLPGAPLIARPPAARVALAGKEEKFVRTTRVFDAPQIDPKAQGQGFLLRLDEAGALFAPGTAVTAYLETGQEPLRGVLIPSSALVRWGGKTWVYVLLDDRRLARREVALDRPTQDGWFSTSGLASGEAIVVEGPQMLLSEEQKGQIHVSD